MKYAIASEEQQVFQHFGKCPGFEIVDIEGGHVLQRSYLSSNGSGHSALVDLLKQVGVNTLVCGGIGNGARTALMDADIALISGAKGHIDIIINKLGKGTLKDDPSGICTHHEHDSEHHCGEHTCK